MKIDEIENGYVLDHISAGNGMRVYEALGLINYLVRLRLFRMPSQKNSALKI